MQQKHARVGHTEREVGGRADFRNYAIIADQVILDVRQQHCNGGPAMNHRFALVLSLVLATFCYSKNATAQKPSSGDNAIHQADFKFDGVWKPKEAMLGGTKLAPTALQAITLTIKNGNYEVSAVGQPQSDKGIYLLDELVSPKRMVIKSVSGPNQGKIILAIYETKNANAMRVCYDLSGRAFPTEFKAPKGSDLYLTDYRRQTPKDSGDKQSHPKPNSKADAKDQ